MQTFCEHCCNIVIFHNNNNIATIKFTLVLVPLNTFISSDTIVWVITNHAQFLKLITDFKMS